MCNFYSSQNFVSRDFCVYCLLPPEITLNWLTLLSWGPNHPDQEDQQKPEVISLDSFDFSYLFYITLIIFVLYFSLNVYQRSSIVP